MSESLQISAELRLADFSLSLDEAIPLHGVTGLFGPSGSGKTSCLRIVAGLEDRSRGRVRFRDQAWQDTDRTVWVPPWQRAVGFVFQDARLFAHLDVAGNLDFADRRSQGSRKTYDVGDVVQALDIGDLLHRSPRSLSGGEGQRVAIARSLLARPDLLLLDEPMSGLDAKRRAGILPVLETLFRQFDLPAIFVSHSAEDMARLADHVLVMNAGQIVERGPVADVVQRAHQFGGGPSSEPLTVIDVTVLEDLEALCLTSVEIDGMKMTVPELSGAIAGDRRRLVIRPSDVVIATERPAGLSVRNVLPAKVEAVSMLAGSPYADVDLRIGAQRLTARLTRMSVDELAIQSGAEVWALIKTASFDRRD